MCCPARFRADFERAGRLESLAGKIVLTVNDFDAYAGPGGRTHQGVPPDEKTAADELHNRKIGLADEMMVLNVGGYIGEPGAIGDRVRRQSRQKDPLPDVRPARRARRADLPDLDQCICQTGIFGCGHWPGRQPERAASPA